MRHWLPAPLTSAALLVTWLLLNQSVALGHVLLGTMLALSVPLLARKLQPWGDPRPRQLMVLFRLLRMAFVEIVRSAFNVSSIILFRRADKVRSQFIRVPLELRNPYGLALLSMLINTTPGTVWVELLPGTHDLALHVFDLHDEQWWIDTIKNRYEKPLIEIFDHEVAP
jgi:multicomponent K+:H+ antiporter subunit E